MDSVIIVASEFYFYKLPVFLRNVRIKLSVSISHVYSFLHVYVFCDYNASRSIESLCLIVSNNYSESAKYDKNRQRKNQRLTIL